MLEGINDDLMKDSKKVVDSRRIGSAIDQDKSSEALKSEDGQKKDFTISCSASDTACLMALSGIGRGWRIRCCVWIARPTHSEILQLF